ncbi:MAG TPA: DUF3025 domain-containing protein [Ramlibacter sp.]|nr:DUF3025 domain-containing protein [Ramlibacter sp.]
MESRLSPLDWASPWLQPWRALGEPAAALAGQGAPVHEALNCAGHAPLRFVAAEALPPGMPYEQFIFEQGQCPTRDGAHDFFNGIVWLGMPLAKRRLNALQAEQLATLGVGGLRGPVRDAITVFDENGALLDAPAPLWEALLARQWQRAFIELRPLWHQARLLVFGHALLEKLAAPRKDMTAHVWRAPAPLADLVDLGQADAWLAGELSAAALASKPFTPLPVLGVPGWCAANENFSFYDDSGVFRPARGAKPSPFAPSAFA